QELGTLGFECTLEEVDLEDITKNQINTIKACTSEDPGVKKKKYIQFQHHIFMQQLKCLRGIYEDLNAYRAELENFNDQKVLATIDEMMKVSIS
ncbi:IL12A protein, partial [Ibidorhyncha struthersii]|nr:IL12A protein [Ibidorhyncha struthersii]